VLLLSLVWLTTGGQLTDKLKKLPSDDTPDIPKDYRREDDDDDDDE
jgi:hypothetical protein